MRQRKGRVEEAEQINMEQSETLAEAHFYSTSSTETATFSRLTFNLNILENWFSCEQR